jgi:hypothetical protein
MHMTDLAKAIAFATHCLKWTHAFLEEEEGCLFVCDRGSDRSFDRRSANDLEAVVQEFLGNRYFIQINRGTSSLFRWRVIVGWQDGTDKSKSLDHAVGVGEDLWDAVFDACVQAASLG